MCKIFFPACFYRRALTNKCPVNISWLQQKTSCSSSCTPTPHAMTLFSVFSPTCDAVSFSSVLVILATRNIAAGILAITPGRRELSFKWRWWLRWPGHHLYMLVRIWSCLQLAPEFLLGFVYENTLKNTGSRRPKGNEQQELVIKI